MRRSTVLFNPACCSGRACRRTRLIYFKHALVRDAAYGTLLREPRRAIHARIADTLESQFTEISDSQPEILAHHYTEAGLAEIAIGYWQKAGEYALRRSANAEAAAHLSKAIALVATLPASAARNREELSLQMALGSAIRANTGHASAETLHVYTRARELLDDSVPLKEQMAVLYGLWAVDVTRANNERALEIACHRGTSRRFGGVGFCQSDDWCLAVGHGRFRRRCGASRTSRDAI